MPQSDEPTFEQLLAWIMETDEEGPTFAEWLREQERKEPKPPKQ